MSAMPNFDLGRDIGPMPAGAWLAAIAGGLGLLWYSRNHSSASAATIDPTQSLVGTGGAGAVGAGGYFYPTSGAGDPSAAAVSGGVTTNQQWMSQAFSWLAGQGMAPDMADKALRDYLSGIQLSVQENALISQALGKFGQPPEALPDAPPIPTVPPPPSPPAPAPPAPVYTPPPPAPAPAPPRVNTYTVRPGDSLSRIAARYPDPRITWQSIYNANRGVIGGNPNLIHPGQVLVIA